MRRTLLRLGPLFFCLSFFLGGCAQFVPQTAALRTDWPAGVPRSLELDGVPFFPQTEYQCGPSALATVLGSLGSSALPDELAKEVYLPGRQGSLQIEMLAAPRRHGFVSWQMPPSYQALLRELAAGHPVLVLQDLGIWPITQWHYAVVVGFDYESGTIFLRSGEKKREALPFTIFEVSWKKSDYWAMVVTQPGSIPATASEVSFQPAMMAYERTAQQAGSRRAWEAFSQRWPGNSFAGIALGNRYYAAGELQRARAVLQAAVDRNPESAEALNNLAQVLSELGRDDEALQVIDRATALKDGPFTAEIAATRAGIIERMQSSMRLKLSGYGGAGNTGAAAADSSSGTPPLSLKR
jgi:hypothetical protein